MSYPFDPAIQLVGRGSLDLGSATDIWAGLAMEGTSLAGAGEGTATNLTLISYLNECNYSGYARVQVTANTLTYDTTGHEYKLTFSPIQWANLAVSTSPPVVGSFFYKGTSSTGQPLFWFDTKPLFPFESGGMRALLAPNSGAVRIGR